MTEATLLGLWLAGALVAGSVARLIALPPMVGFLLAGVAGTQLGFATPEAAFKIMSELGVELLLFTIGLKIRISELVRPLILTTGLAQIGLFGVLCLPILWLFQPAGPAVFAIAIGLAFSSTVMAAKVLEARRETRAFHGRLTIGVLVLQDIVAVVLVSLMAGSAPSPFALGLFALPLLRPLLHKAMDRLGDSELQVIGGTVLALVVGAGSFKALGLSAELGALVMGTLLAGHPRAKDLSNNLWGFRELMLVGFFLLVGSQVQFDWGVVGLVAVLLAMLPVKGLLWMLILSQAKLRSYTGFLTATNLFSYSEFALVVASGALAAGLLTERWMGAMALAVVASFIVAAPVTRMAHTLFERLERRLTWFEKPESHPDDQPLSVGKAKVLIMGMGRVGTGAYMFLRERGISVTGLDADPTKMASHIKAGRRVLFADAEDPGLWRGLKLGGVTMIVLAMPDPEAQTHAIQQLRHLGYKGIILSGSRRRNHIQEAMDAGSDLAYDVAEAAGTGLGERAFEQLVARTHRA